MSHIDYIKWGWLQMWDSDELLKKEPNISSYVDTYHTQPSSIQLSEYTKCKYKEVKEIERILKSKYPNLFKQVKLIFKNKIDCRQALKSISRIQSEINSINDEQRKEFLKSRVSYLENGIKEAKEKNIQMSITDHQRVDKWKRLGVNLIEKKNSCQIKRLDNNKSFAFKDCQERYMKNINKSLKQKHSKLYKQQKSILSKKTDCDKIKSNIQVKQKLIKKATNPSIKKYLRSEIKISKNNILKAKKNHKDINNQDKKILQKWKKISQKHTRDFCKEKFLKSPYVIKKEASSSK